MVKWTASGCCATLSYQRASASSVCGAMPTARVRVTAKSFSQRVYRGSRSRRRGPSATWVPTIFRRGAVDSAIGSRSIARAKRTAPPPVVGSARGADGVDERHLPAADLLDGAGERGAERVGIRDRPRGPTAHAAGDTGHVGRRVGGAHADPGVLHGAAAYLGDAQLVLLVVVVAAVVADDDQQRQLVVRGGPQRLRRHHEVAVADDGHRQLARVLAGHRRAGPVAQPTAATVAAVLARLRELPDPGREAARPAQRQHPLLALDGVVHLGHQPAHRDRAVGPALGGLALPAGP